MWVAATLIAAAAQTARNAAQSGLVAQIGTIGATGVRFLFGLPFALLFLAVAGQFDPVPSLTAGAFGWAATGAAAQVAATALMLTAMRTRGFAAATALIKTEPVTLAIMAAILLGDRLTLPQLGAIVTATAGVVLMSGTGWQRASLRPVAVAVLAGALFGVSAIGFRGGILALDGGGFVIRATTILCLSLAIQTAAVAPWLALRDRPALRGMIRAWRASLGAGFLGAVASQFWFIGFALAPAANVRTLALIEVVFASVVSLHRGDRIGLRQAAGMAMIAVGVGWLLWTAR